MPPTFWIPPVAMFLPDNQIFLGVQPHPQFFRDNIILLSISYRGNVVNKDAQSPPPAFMRGVPERSDGRGEYTTYPLFRIRRNLYISQTRTANSPSQLR